MRKSERLLQLLVLLRGRRRASTANELANRLQVSQRTIYRDIQSLLLSGVDIVGEAGVGYCLQPGSGIPPLMFNEKELEALVLGIRLVKGWADDELCAAASTAQDKIKAVLPPRIQQVHEHKLTKYLVPDYHRQSHVKFSEVIRSSIDSTRVLEIEYSDEKSKASTRTIKPLGLVFWGAKWTLVAWCQLRDDYRLFRLDRIADAKPTQELFSTSQSCSF
ncbi:MAG: YafY family protein [Proteobacteria bacterium]|nr:YafY family protein [Pseudomonadota bacterium]MDA1289337.1 YafY family protein [Pseudomonadota bacterium]